MRLKRLKVSGFKSFVDPTPITVPANLVGIVGPNGCGKSNVIDAVRWVMGESSAKTLRGDQMADVIFNGSTSRKPVGKASVELMFQNDDGKVPESYANFSEIAIRRTLTRDGKSEYFINGARARRKDIQDIFRGTGLGPRSYSIIEQGMVSRIIESRPEDLRSFVEEAAGISKYKDRRRETENRIRHTRENLDRVVDIIRELDQQLRRLQRQSQAAQRYKKLREEERLVQGQLLVMRRNSLQNRAAEQARVLAEHENRLQQTIAEQRAIEERIESLRMESGERRETFDGIQGRYYEVGSKISALEQRIAHERETRRQRMEDLERLTSSLEQLDRERAGDDARVKDIRARIATLEQDRGKASAALQQAASAMAEAEAENARLLHEWDAFNASASAPQRQIEVQKSVIEEQRNQRDGLGRRLERMDAELVELREQIDASDPQGLREQVASHSKVVEETAASLKQSEETIGSIRVQLEQALDENSQLSRERHSDAARLTSLKEIQSEALGQDDEEFHQWLAGHGLGEADQLVSSVEVAEGWQQAVDAVLGRILTATVSERPLDQLSLENATSADLALVEAAAGGRFADDPGYLAHYVRSERADLGALVGSVRVAETLEDALAMRSGLGSGETVVSRDGALVGRNWVRLPGGNSAKLGILAREEEIRALGRRIAELDGRLARVAAGIATLREQLRQQEGLRNQRSQALTLCNREHADLQNRLGQREARHTQLSQRLERFESDREEVLVQISRCEQRIDDAGNLKLEAEQAVARLESEREKWRQRREDLAARLEQGRRRHHEARDRNYQIETQWQIETSNLRGVEESLRRLETRHSEVAEQTEALNQALSTDQSPEAPLEASLNELLASRENLERELNLSRQESERVEQEIQRGQQTLHQVERQVEERRESLSQRKLENREIELRLQTLGEQIAEEKHDVEAIAAELPEGAEETAWRENLAAIEQKISRIGPVNLVAIEEFEEQSERKIYLDKQHQDLVSALETLEGVIRKIDRETRTRFKDTFDALNSGFQTFFPQLFGGGSAILELTENDFLTAGVTVMARPPGKKNSTIHLLSGGEKALTAVSLLFSLFKLNPAPFCLLDEVDAPLDDANVERYCKTLKSLSEHTQILVITHNKITMEAADVLVGVTMSEPGVSRMVAVDIDEAVKMAAV